MKTAPFWCVLLLAAGCGGPLEPVQLDKGQLVPSSDAKHGCDELVGTRVYEVSPCRPP
jgi:hypothetical protein